VLYVQLDVNWVNEPAIIRAGLDGAGVHAALLCLYARNREGIPWEEVWARNIPDELIERLEDLGLVEVRDGLLHPEMGDSRISGARRHIPLAIRRAVMERDGYACVDCGAQHDLALDHIHPYSLGGPDTVENLRVLCRSCNSRKGAKV
jgi:hypothetical protein